ncbi:MAG: hypothetical protein AB7U82_26395 [Blastocatellales bacterium]
MRKFFAVLILTVLFAGAALADVLYLRNGSVLRGTFVGYENGKFIFETSGQKLQFAPNQVSRLVIERSDTVGNVPRRDDRYPSRDPNNTPPSSGGRWESAAPFDVKLEDQWHRSQIQVARGQRVRVEASGTIYLEGRTATAPEGLQGRRDQDAPMPEQNDGALVAAIGQDPNSPSIFIGRSREFTADRDGILYFTVNHWETRSANGAFRVNVAVDRSGGGETGAGSSGGSRPSQGREKTVTVYANQPWTDTGINVEPNTTYEITAEGTIDIGNRSNSNPDGNRNANLNTSSYPMNDVGVGALIGKIRYRDGRDSNLVFIGSRGAPATEPNEYGRLFLGVNDDFFRDNKGSYRVTIRW